MRTGTSKGITPSQFKKSVVHWLMLNHEWSKVEAQEIVAKEVTFVENKLKNDYKPMSVARSLNQKYEHQKVGKV